jgi:UDP-sulfoquinovose synthase
MRILILGGDGYLGWPTTMKLSNHGHQVAVADNYLKRQLVRQEDVEPLFDVPNLHERTRLWETISGNKIHPYIGDLNDWPFVARIFQEFKPEAVIHYAEQPSGPYSMLNRHAGTLTLHNNLGVTANVIFAVHEFCPEAHIVKIGTMGEYGTPDIDIEEGWLEVQHNGRQHKFLYPRQAGSLYHTTKVMDTDLLWYYVRVWDLRVTDLMQGPVYGIFTNENQEHEQLLQAFHYDEMFGTLLNRFIVQSVADYPLTVYGKGGQTRGYLNIKDTMECVRLSVEKPAQKGELRILNQFTEAFTVNDLADKVQSVGKTLGLNVRIQNVDNPRKEKEEHYYNPKHTGILELGLQPHLLTDDVLVKMMQYVMKHQSNIQTHKIFRNVKWA